MSEQSLDEALFRDGEPNRVDKIEISIVGGCQFRWSLHSDGKEIFSGLGGCDQVEGMARATVELINAQLGVPPAVPAIAEHSLN